DKGSEEEVTTDTVSKLLSSFFKEDKTKPEMPHFAHGLRHPTDKWSNSESVFFFSEAAVRSQKQAESEDCDQVEIEHFEKILPQLVWRSIGSRKCFYYFYFGSDF
uniref:Centromere protein X n=1 Tax=Amphilophus citrinellus TaxID=61819 RepID=A0A3Q0S4W3_AMPCI